MKTHTMTFAAFAAASLLGVSAYAGPGTTKPMKPVAETMSDSCITGDIGFDVVSEYITKGQVQQNQGFIIQPYADLHFRIAKNVGAIDSITVDLGIWNSMHAHSDIGGRGTTAHWYEFDFKSGLTFNVAKFAISPYFIIYESPSDAFRSAYAIGLNLAYDDSTLLGAFALHPYIFGELNVQGTTGDGFRHTGSGNTFRINPANGQYFEAGIAPGHSFGDLTLTLPIKAGFGSGNEYAFNRAFGYFSVGADAAYALSFVPKCLGTWSVHAGVAYYRLGSGAAYTAAPFGRTDGMGNVLPGDKNQVVFQGGMKVAF